MTTLGQYHTLRIIKSVDFGLYLQGDNGEEILLPRRYVTPQMHIGDEVEVFLYLDQDERIVATTERPFATVGQFAYLECSWTNQYGAFLKWGLQMKDLFCPFREQRKHMEVGRKYIVYVKLDEESYRLMATAKVERYLVPAFAASSPATPASNSLPADSTLTDNNHSVNNLPSNNLSVNNLSVNTPSNTTALSHSTPVSILIWKKTDLGFKCIVNNRYQGLIYDNQIFQPLKTGDQLTAYVDHVRQDGKIDITLQPTGHRHTLDFAEQLLRYLYENDGKCPLGDHSPAEDIQATFNVSKKTFKKAIGDLYRRQLIVITEEGISLTQ